MRTELPAGRGVDGLVSIVIPTMERAEQLQALLDAIHASHIEATSLGWEVEALVCNDGRPLASVELPSWAQLIEGPHRGAAANRNVGITASRGSWVVLVDDDCIPRSDWLVGYLKAFESPANARIGVFEGRTTTDRPSRRMDETSPVNETGGYFWTCNIAFRRTCLEAIGLMNEDFPYADLEDVEFAERHKAAGECSVFVADAVVVHPFRIQRPLHELRTHRASVPVLVKAHPHLAWKFTRRAYAELFAREVLRFPARLVRARGRGVARAVGKLAMLASLMVRPPQTARRP